MAESFPSTDVCAVVQIVIIGVREAVASNLEVEGQTQLQILMISREIKRQNRLLCCKHVIVNIVMYEGVNE